MVTTILQTLTKRLSVSTTLPLLLLLSWANLGVVLCQGQESSNQPENRTSLSGDGRATIIVETADNRPKPPLFYTARADAKVQIGPERIEQSIELAIKVIQGEAKTLSFGLRGEGPVSEVKGENLQSWAVRREGSERFLDLHLEQVVNEQKVTITVRSGKLQLPTAIDLTHLTPGKSVGFESMVSIHDAPGIQGVITAVNGFSPLDPKQAESPESPLERFYSSTGGRIRLSLNRDGSSPPPVELINTKLSGTMNEDLRSISFELVSTAHVSEPNTKITILSGNAALSQLPTDSNYRLRLSKANKMTVYQLVFPQAGTFPITLNFIATLESPQANSHRMDFTIAASGVVPLTLSGLGSDLEFHRDQQSVVPVRNDADWKGFLPATGRARLQWKTARKAAEGKLFFTTTGQIEARVGAGLLRQDHQINYQVLQGDLKSLRILLQGPGEILDVQGSNVVAWKVSSQEADRQLDITLSQPINGSGQIKVHSQTPLGAFPVRVDGLRLSPVGAVRHSGYLRLSNLGSVRLEPTGLVGLTQLAPDQFPGKTIQARQTFVYRFPATEYQFTLAADRIQAEVNVAELVLYELAETDRVIQADIELDVREAPIREWDFLIPSDYSVVSVTGASVADYISASEVTDSHRNLKVTFSQAILGRQLVQLHLEKNLPATEEDWRLPRIDHPGAKSIRGDIGIIGAPGFRIAVVETNLLVEKPLSYFPKPVANLQQAFRIREPGWSATLQIELLDRSIQSDVFHLYSLNQETVYGSALINYFVTGAPVSEWNIAVPATLGNVMVDGQNVRTWRRDGDTLIVSLHQPVMGPYTLLVTFEEKPNETNSTFQAGKIAPIGVQGERGYIQIVSPMQVEITTTSMSKDMLKLDPLELPAEFRLLSTAPSLGTWQYTERPFDLHLKVNWFQPGSLVTQLVEFSEATTRVSQDGELVTDVVYYVKSRGRRTLRIQLPPEPVRLWEISVNGQPVTARQTDHATLIPLPGNTDPNLPVEVNLRLGKPSVRESSPELSLPIVDAPILKTQWNIQGDEQRVLIPQGGTVEPQVPVLRPSGFDWVTNQGMVPLISIGLLNGLGIWACRKKGPLRLLGLAGLGLAVFVCFSTATMALSDTALPAPLQVSLPILPAGELVEFQAKNISLWRVNLSGVGITALLAGLAAVIYSFFKTRSGDQRILLRGVGALLIALGILFQGDGAPLFFTMLALAILSLAFIPPAWTWVRGIPDWFRNFSERRRAKKTATPEAEEAGAGPATATLLLVVLSFLASSAACRASVPEGFEAANAITQQWQLTHRDARLTANGTIKLSGQPGDRFLLLKAPAILTRFEAQGLRLNKRNIPGEGLAYIISIPVVENTASSPEETDTTAEVTDYQATFEFQLEAIDPIQGIPVLSGTAAVQQITVTYDEANWEVFSPTAIRIEPLDIPDSKETRANLLLRPGKATLSLKPQARDVTTEARQFFVEASNLYIPGPGVIDGNHKLHIRTSQGEVDELNVQVPAGITVSDVTGPVGSWQFDADSGGLKLEIEPSQSQAFDVMIHTQRGLSPLPADVVLAPLRVADASGEVGLVAIAFGPDAQPEKSTPTDMSAVNLGDFDSSLIPNERIVLHRVYRYGAEGGQLALRVAPVDSEVRVVSKQVLSLGDERVVLGINFTAEIARAGLFQLSFPLPQGLEVESLTGSALHHWSELTEGDQRQIILHLNGKTMGAQDFSITLTGSAPTQLGDWVIPRFELKEATRQTGELVVRPTTGIRLRTVSRQNVSETDPRSLGGTARGALAFRLLQGNWKLLLGIEKLEPWLTGQVLHDITLREGQTRSTLLAHFNVQNASIRALRVNLPITNEDEIKTVRASGETISDFVRTDPESNIWEVQFKRRVVGGIDFRIEYERRGDRANENETLNPATFPQARQLSYYFSVRAGGRLEIEHSPLSQGWQRADWNTFPQKLRDAGNRNAPALALRALDPENTLQVQAKRHSLADALKLRVAKGSLTTVLSPSGDQLTAVDVTMEVIQRSSLIVGLPVNGELFSIFVNGESVHSIRQSGETNEWQFYILPGIDDRTAKVRFVYSVPGKRLNQLRLLSPNLNVPLENIEWNVVAPHGFELTDHDGNLELVRQLNQATYDVDSYLSKITGKREVQAQQAAQLLEQANNLLQAGEQTKARWALNSVANQYALDAASNEDARVQLENLQTQQAIVGLNTRRQRLYLDNNKNDTALADNQQLRQAAADNPILQQNQLNFRPQELSQLLRGNTSEDNAILQQIAGRLVQHQHTTDPAPQAMLISLPEEGTVYAFSRSVQVAENAPLVLDLDFDSQLRIPLWKILVVSLFLVIVIASLTTVTTRRPSA